MEADILARAGTHGIDTDGLKCYAFLFGMATVMIADANRTIERLERAAAKTEHACDECENLYDTQAEADACCTMQGARLDDEPRDDSHDYTYSDPRWDRWEGGER